MSMKQTLRATLSHLAYLPRALGLVWSAAPAWTLAWAALLVAQGLLPVATVSLTRQLVDGLTDIEQVFINGDLERRVPHNLNISFNFVEGESLIMGVKGIAVSSGSACTSASLEPSYVLKALGAGDDLAHSSIRFGLGRWTTEEEIDYVADKLTTVVTRLREMSPLYELAKEGVDLSTMQWQTEGH